MHLDTTGKAASFLCCSTASTRSKRHRRRGGVGSTLRCGRFDSSAFREVPSQQSPLNTQTCAGRGRASVVEPWMASPRRDESGRMACSAESTPRPQRYGRCGTGWDRDIYGVADRWSAASRLRVGATIDLHAVPATGGDVQIVVASTAQDYHFRVSIGTMGLLPSRPPESVPCAGAGAELAAGDD